MTGIASQARWSHITLCIGGPLSLLFGALIVASVLILWAVTLAAIDFSTFGWLSKRMKARLSLVTGVMAICVLAFALSSSINNGHDPLLLAQTALYDQTGIATGRLRQTRINYIDVRITRLENCVRYEDSSASDMSERKAGCIKTFVIPVDRKRLEQVKDARAAGDLVEAQFVLEQIYREPMFRNANSAAYPEFVSWWKGDAGFRCRHDMENEPAAVVIVYCGGSHPDVVKSFCDSQGTNKSRDREPLLRELCDPASGRMLETLAKNAFEYCFAGTCLYPDTRRGPFISVDPLI